MKETTFEIYGYSTGDRSVGIGSIEFCLDSGLDLSNYDEKDIENFKERNISKTRILNNLKKKLDKLTEYHKKLSYIEYVYFLLEELLFELHDNGNIRIYDNLINKDD